MRPSQRPEWIPRNGQEDSTGNELAWRQIQKSHPWRGPSAPDPGMWAGHPTSSHRPVVNSQNRYETQSARQNRCSLRGSLFTEDLKRSVPSLQGSQVSSSKQSGSAKMKSANSSGKQESSKPTPAQSRSNASLASGRRNSEISISSYRNAGSEVKRHIFPKHEFSANFSPRDDIAYLNRDDHLRSIRRRPGYRPATARSAAEREKEPRPRPMTAKQAKYEEQVSQFNHYEFSPRPITGYKRDYKEKLVFSAQGYGDADLEMFACPSSKLESKHPHMATFGGYYSRANFGGYFQRQKHLSGEHKSFRKRS